MQNKNHISENEKNSYDFLDKIENTTPFTTPQNYFEELHQVINNKKLINSNLKYNFDILSPRISIPILSILIMIAVYFSFTKNTTPKEFTNEEISQIVMNEKIDEFDEDLIFEVYSETAFETEPTTDDEIIEYLIENNININSIIEEL